MENNKKYITNGWLAIIIVILILVIDQIIKIEVKTNMTLGEAIRITDWFYIDSIVITPEVICSRYCCICGSRSFVAQFST